MKQVQIKKTFEDMFYNDFDGMYNRFAFSSAGLAIIWAVCMSIKKGSYWEYYKWAYTKEGIKKSFKVGFLITLVASLFALVPSYIKETKKQEEEIAQKEYTTLE